MENKKVHSIKQIIGYRKDSIVSRVLIKQNTGTVTAFAFDKGQDLSEHTAPFDALVQIVEGSAEITIDGRPYPIKEGELILMPADVPHRVHASEKFKMMLIMIKAASPDCS